MKGYIEREEYRSRLSELEEWCQDLRKPGLKQALEMFDEIPAADVAPVVRCKECRKFKTYGCRMVVSGYDDFCSYGERKNVDHAEEGCDPGEVLT